MHAPRLYLIPSGSLTSNMFLWWNPALRTFGSGTAPKDLGTELTLEQIPHICFGDHEGDFGTIESALCAVGMEIARDDESELAQAKRAFLPELRAKLEQDQAASVNLQPA